MAMDFGERAAAAQERSLKSVCDQLVRARRPHWLIYLDEDGQLQVMKAYSRVSALAEMPEWAYNNQCWLVAREDEGRFEVVEIDFPCFEKPNQPGQPNSAAAQLAEAEVRRWQRSLADSVSRHPAGKGVPA